MSDLRLVVFDVDGTLVDSQGEIVAAMTEAFAAQDVPLPPRETLLSIVGLSLPVAMARLAPEVDETTLAHLVETYRTAFAENRRRGALPPLYPGALDVLDRLAAEDDTLLGIATGKSRRGLAAILEAHGLANRFLTRQVADDHPSKPHPAMLRAALAETGVEADRAVMVGDTTYDIEMAGAAGMASVAVSWGYHAPKALGGADRVIGDFAALPAVLNELLEQQR